MSAVDKFNSLTIEELENYGRDTQSTINESTNDLLKGFKCIDFGEYGKKVSELSVFANKSTNKLTAIAPIAKVNQLLGRYDTMENQLAKVENTVNEHRDKLNKTINLLLDVNIGLGSAIDRFNIETEELREYTSHLLELKSKGELDDDDLKLQIAANRLKVLTTFKVSSEHVRLETMLQIKMLKEKSSQMEDSVIDVFPQFKLQLINAIGIKLHKDCTAILDGVYKMANDSVLESANQIASMAIKTQEDRQREIIKPETLLQANTIIQNALKKVVEDASNEANVNIEIANRLEETSKQMQSLVGSGNKRLVG